MKLTDFITKNQTNYQVIQKMFLKIKVKSYFDFLAEKTWDSELQIKCQELLVYSDADSNYKFDLNISHLNNINENITIGELLCIAQKITYCVNPINKQLSEDEGQEIKLATARNIAYSLMVEPFVKYYNLKCVSNQYDVDLLDGFDDFDDSLF